MLCYLRSAYEEDEELELDEPDDQVSVGMSLIYTDGDVLIQARVIRIVEVKSNDLQRVNVELKTIPSRTTKSQSCFIDLDKASLTIGSNSFDTTVVSSSMIVELFLTLTHLALSYWSLFNYYQLAPKGAPGWPCQFLHIVLAPVFKPLAPSMWVALMSVGQFVIWRSTATTPEGARRATATKLTPPPLPLNIVTYVCIYATALPLLVWVAAALPFLFLMILPPLWPQPLVTMVLIPAMLLWGLPFCLHRIERVANGMFAHWLALGAVVPDSEAKPEDDEDDEESRSLLLKVFATIM